MNNKSALFTLFLVVLIDLLGFGIVLPLLPFYASQFNASPLAVGLLYSVYSLAQLVFSPFWGGLSDRIGRKPVMLVSIFGAFCAYILFGLSHSLAVLFISRIVAGVMGGNISTAQAYVADITDHENRAKGMGLIGAAFGVGFMLGPAIATLLIHPAFHDFFRALGAPSLANFLSLNRYALPGFFAAALSFISLVLVYTCLPEPQRHAETDATRIIRSSVFKKDFWGALFSPGQGLTLLLISLFLLSLGQSSLYSAFPLFCKFELGLPAEKVGLQFAFMGLIAVLLQGGLIHPLQKAFGEKRLFITGCFLMAAGLALIPQARSEKFLMAALAVMAVGGSLNGPTLNSLISKKAPPGAVGRVLGGAQGLAALGRVIGPAWGGFLYPFSYKAPFVATALIVLLTVVAGFKLRKT